MRAPPQLQLHQMGSDVPFRSFVAHALVDQALHPIDQHRRGQPALGLYRAPKLAVNRFAHVLEHFSQETLGQSFSLCLARRFWVFSHSGNHTSSDWGEFACRWPAS